jgi:lysozyme
MNRKPVRKKAVIRRKTRKKSSFFTGKLIRFSIIGFFILLCSGVGYHYRNGLLYYLGFKSYKLSDEQAAAKRISDVRNFQVLENHKGKAIGFDVSEYQGEIDWTLVKNIEGNYPLEFVLIRATAGKDREDVQFRKNWLASKDKKMIRGAYHYYRPNENSLEQAKIFIQTHI